MKRAAVLAAIWGVVTAAAVVVPACYSDNCAGQIVTYGRQPGEGRMLDENTWESSPQVGKWLFFGSARSYVFDVPAWGDRAPEYVIPYVSPVEDPNVVHPDQFGSNFTVGGGNLAELSFADRNRINVRNGTCALYYLRLVVVLSPLPPNSTVDAGESEEGGVEAGADADVDAGVDAGLDAGDAGDGEAGP